MIKRIILTTMALVFSTLSQAQTDHVALPGKTYALIDPPAQNIRTALADKVEVVEVFSYTCGHCYQLEAPVAAWLKNKSEDISFVRLHMPSSNWVLLSKSFFTLEALNKVDIGHPALFDAIQKQRKRFKTKEEVAKFLGGIGIDGEEFLKAWDSFSVKANYDRAADLTTNQYKVNYTPLFIIDGKYLVDGTTSQASSYEGIVEAVNKRALEVLEEKKISTIQSVEGVQPADK